MPDASYSKALARFVLARAKNSNGRSLDQQWADLASFLRGPASSLARWLAVAQMHSVYRQMRAHKKLDERRSQSLLVRTFVERACAETGLSRPTIYNYVDRARALVDVLDPALLKEMLSGREKIANDEHLLIKVAQLPAAKAVRVVETYMRGRGEASAACLAERYLHEHRIAALASRHEPQLRGGQLVGNPAPADETDKGPTDVRNVVLFGDVLVHLRERVPAACVQVCVTSPPYWGQRDFGIRQWFGGDAACRHKAKTCCRCGAWYGQLGLEPAPEMYVEHLVEVFREVRRALREDGVFWLNLGDSYFGDTPPRNSSSEAFSKIRRGGPRRSAARIGDLKPKDLMGIPWQVALALRTDGWHLRSDVIWHKTTPLPEAVRDRPTRSHEHIFMFAKSAAYFYDATAVMEPTSGGTRPGSKAGPKDARPGIGIRANRSFIRAFGIPPSMRNCRDVWSFPPGRFPDAHTATFPPELPERCIRASTSEHGACAICGAPWCRRTHHPRATEAAERGMAKEPGEKFLRGRMRAGRLGKSRIALPPTETIGWEPTCDCGTTLAVAKQLGRDYLGVELNEKEYRPIIERRLADADRPPAAREQKDHARRSAARS